MTTPVEAAQCSRAFEFDTAAAAAPDLRLHRARAEQQVEAWPVFTAHSAAAVLLSNLQEANYVSSQVGFTL